MTENEIYVDVWCVLDGNNKPFLAYMPYEQAVEIQQNGGLDNCESITLRETLPIDGEKARKIPQSLREGLTTIIDVWVKTEMQADKVYYLN